MKKYFTKVNLLSFLFYFVFTGIAFSIMDNWRIGIIQAFFSSVIFILFMPLLQKINAKTATKLMLKMPLEGEGNAILCGGANHFKNWEAVGGKMVLFHDLLVFKSHKFNIQNHQLHLPLNEISNIEPYAVWGLVPTGLKISLANGQTEKFVVGNRDEWIAAILAARAITA